MSLRSRNPLETTPCAKHLISSYLGYATPYGATGFCASAPAFFLIPVAGSGGPSNLRDGCFGRRHQRRDAVQRQLPGLGKAELAECSLANPHDGVRDLPDVIAVRSRTACGTTPMCSATRIRLPASPCVGAPSNWSLGGGTSFGTPIMAGMQALVDQVWGGPPRANPAPVYYTLARQRSTARGGKQTCEKLHPRRSRLVTCTF